MARPLFLGCACLLACATVQAQPLDRKLIDRIVQDSLRAWAVPGAALVVVRDDRIIHLQGYGKRALGGDGAITADTLFPLGSCSKAFTVAGIGMLADDGTLKWDDPVRRHLPEFHLSEPHADALVTLRDLCSHRTGVGPHDWLWYRAPWDQNESMRRIGRVPLEGPFRAHFAYNSIMFLAAGSAAGRYHAGGWAGLTRERILNPLGMTATVLTSTDAAKAKDRAAGHRRNSAGQVEPAPEYPMPVPSPSGSVYSSASDLGAWLRFQLGDGRWRGNRLISSLNLAEPHRPHNLIPLDGPAKASYPETQMLAYGLAWTVQDYRGVRLVQHGGRIDGFRAHLALLPEYKIGWAILCNLGDNSMNVAISNTLVDSLLELPAKDWNAYFGEVERAADKARDAEARRRDAGRRPDEKPSRPLADYAGEFTHPAYGTCKVGFEAGKLHWEWSSFRCDLLPYRGDVFELHDAALGDQLATFTIGSQGVARIHVLDIDFTKSK